MLKIAAILILIGASVVSSTATAKRGLHPKRGVLPNLRQGEGVRQLVYLQGIHLPQRERVCLQ